MDVYYAVVVLTVWATVAQLRRNRRLDLAVLAVCAVAIALIAGLRWYADIDYGPYAEMYNENPLLGDLDQASLLRLYGEGGYLILTAVFKTLGSPFVLLALLCAVTSVGFKALVAARFSRHASLALCLYLCLHFVTIEFIQMRWAVATGLLSLGFWYQYERRTRAAVVCFALSVAFHYFSTVFWVVAVVVAAKGYRRFALLFLASLVGAVVVKADYLSRFLVSDSDIYVLMRLTRYASDPLSQVGPVSFAKLVMYPVIYAMCVWFRPLYPWRTDRRNLFLFKLALTSLSVTLLVTFIPTMHFRATVIADFFAILWVLYALDRALSEGARAVAFATLGVLFCLWFVIDVSNYVNAGRLYEYQTWIGAIPW